MKKEDLLFLLQDFVEETGMFNHIRIHYTEYRPYKLDIIKKIIIKGINSGLLEIYKTVWGGKQTEHHELNANDAISIVNNESSWFEDKITYEVLFVDTNKYIWILFGDEVGDEQRVPDEFLEFIEE